MGSLYKKALALASKESSLTPSERREINARVDRAAAQYGMEIRPEALAYKPKRNGSLLPILFNLFAVALAAAGVVVMLYLFNRSEGQIAGVTGKIESAEGRLLEALQKETQEQLSRKDQEISQVQLQLEEAGRERDRAQAEAEARIRGQEVQLRQEMQGLLAQERQKLQREGVSAARIEEQMKTLEAQKAGEMEARLARLRAEADAALKEREGALAARMREHEQTLQANRQEQDKLRQALQQQEGQAAAAAADAAELARLRDQGRREQAVSDQILARYLQVRADLSASRYPQALQGLSGLREYLQQPAVAAIPGLQKRLPQETFIIDALQSWIEGTAARQKEAAAPLPADPLEPVNALLAEADLRFQRGEIPQAQSLYKQALEEIPAIRRSYERVLQIETARAERLKQESDARIAEAGRLLKAGDARRAMERYAQSVEPQGDARQWGRILSAVRDSGLQAGRAEESARLKPQLDKLARQLEAQAARREGLRDRIRQAGLEAQGSPALAAAAGDASSERMLGLLKVKMRIREVLESEPVRARDPDLYAGLEQILAAVGTEQRLAGRADGMHDAARVTEMLPAGDLRSLQPVWSAYNGSEDAGRELARLLQAIARVLE